METLGNNFTPKNPKLFTCYICYFNTSNKKDYNRHIETIKHKTNKSICLETHFTQKTPKHSCECGKVYSNNSGLWKHKKKCDAQSENNNINKQQIQQQQILVDYLLKENSEFKQLMLEQNKHMIELAQKAGNNNNIINSNNKTFNLQVFLNETCKDAINMSDFVNQLQVSLSDLEETGRIGYAEGISKVFIKNLNSIDYTDRPIHCNDFKREIIYIKDNNQWTKDDDKKSGLTKAIKQIAHKNIKQISEWQKKNPDFSDPDSRQNDKYMNIVLNSMSGSTEDEQKNNIHKIIRNVAKEVVIEK
jgi:hypothetical protein